jgi:(S)-2-hydroxyglutarate dehydrogenase
MDNRLDVVVIGAGIVGLATAYQLQRAFPGLKMAMVDKEDRVGVHQTGHNSGVLHSGIYYKPGSLKARNCRDGKAEMERFCEEHDVAYETCGKVIVATSENERPLLDRIRQRGEANGVQCDLIDAQRLGELEPHVAGIEALHVPEAGIVDYVAVCDRLRSIIEANGTPIRLGSRVTDIHARPDGTTVETSKGELRAKLIVNCAGLHCDRVAKLAGSQPASQIVPFRGEYYMLKRNCHHLCRNLIYPVPDPSFPFLGVHFTRMVGGHVECGPNAVLAFAREGYRMRDVNPRDLFGSLAYPGFLRLARMHWRAGCGEMLRSISKRAFVRALQRLVPDITGDALEPAPAGVRAQALRRDGSLVDDFEIVDSPAGVHVINAPSPAATSSLSIGRHIASRVAQRSGHSVPSTGVEAHASQ